MLLVAVAAGAVILGVSSEAGQPAMQLGRLSAAPALPATTFGGTPPPAPADAKPASPEASTPATTESPAALVAPAISAEKPPPPPPQPASAPPPTHPPASGPTTFNLIGGTATVSCSSGAPALVSAAPKSGFEMETGSSDGGATLEVKFKSSSHESELQAWCAAGAVQGQVQESTS